MQQLSTRKHPRQDLHADKKRYRWQRTTTRSSNGLAQSVSIAVSVCTTSAFAA
jgi:hypothetical protein